jgi:hypothetical protein
LPASFRDGFHHAVCSADRRPWMTTLAQRIEVSASMSIWE